ncbi:HNH endonuclease family protein [Arthrobacter halodurans]|uniref:HNH endonuclease family protein n=1 Tax=Arthrobacter halodurans TaxID=516699 RepID=A0ABV4UPX0_9MICC
MDRSGCDTHNDMHRTQLTDVVFANSVPCKVASGTLTDPYAATLIRFVRGQQTNSLVQIDHVVAPSDAWRKGAQRLTAGERAAFANDPLNLQATDGATNARKGAGDAATWMPPNKSHGCSYVARQIAVKAKYRLWVARAGHGAMSRVPAACPGQRVPAAAAAAVVPARGTVPAPKPAIPKPAAPRTVVSYEDCAEARAATGGAGPAFRAIRT